MEEEHIHVILYRFGIVFFWDNISPKIKIQLVFRDMNLAFEKGELELFRGLIHNTISNYSNSKNCKNPEHCRNVLFITPIIGLNLAVSTYELYALKDLINGILFNLNLENLLDEIRFN